MRILLTGASGQLGTELAPRLARLGQVTAVAGPGAEGSRGVDLADPDSVRRLLDEADPALVVNAAAYTAVDRAEAEPERAWRLNAALPDRLARWCASRGRRLVHYSTDYVFDGESEAPYREGDPTGPVNAYGAGKLAGERAIAASGCAHVVLRTSWVYSAHGRNFLLTMLDLAGREGQGLRVVDDQVGRPTWARNLAAATGRVLDAWTAGEDIGGLYHYADADTVSWFGFAERIFAAAARRGLLPRVPAVTPVETAAFPTPARRPRHSVLDTARYERVFGATIPGLDASIEACLSQLETEHGRNG